MIGETILRARKRKGWTQQKLSEVSGIAQTVIARYENGTKPNTKNLAKLSKHLDMPITDLVGTTPVVNTDKFDEFQFDKRLKKIRSLPIGKRKVIYDLLGLILDLQSVQDAAAGSAI